MGVSKVQLSSLIHGEGTERPNWLAGEEVQQALGKLGIPFKKFFGGRQMEVKGGSTEWSCPKQDISIAVATTAKAFKSS